MIACVFILISFKSGKVIRLQADFLTDVTYDYDFECVIDDIIYISQFNGQGSKIPYTFFKAKVIKQNNGKTLTNKENAFINFLVDRNKLYYFSIEASVDNSYQPIEFYIKVDNWSNNDPSDLVLVLAGAGTIDLGDYEAQFNNHSKYVEEIEFSVNEWNSLGLIKIYEDNKSTLPNFAIYDNYDSDSTLLAVTLPLVLYNGIYLNDYYFTNMTKFERIKTIIHELGHILGLNEFTGLEEDINVMVQGKREFKQFGPADILVYNYLWGQR